VAPPGPWARTAIRAVTRSELTYGASRCCGCCTLLLYSRQIPGSEFRIYACELWSYGDSNSGPLACHPAAGRPPPSICAGHRPTTSPRVPRNPGRLLYFPAVPLCRRGWSWPPQPAGTRPVRACNNFAGRVSRDPGTRPEPKAAKSRAPARPAAPTTLASARSACLRCSRNAVEVAALAGTIPGSASS
jgi:hypothetical protein